MFTQEQAFETPPIDSLDDPPKKLGKGRHNLLHAVVVWVVQDGVIEVTHQVKQALLLGAWHRVVGSVEIGDQNTVEASQCVLDQAPLARLRVEVDYLADRSKHPDVTDLAVQPDSCFICMNYVACCHGSEDLFSSFLVVFGSV